MVKNDIFSGGASKQNAFFFQKMCPKKSNRLEQALFIPL